MTRTARLIVTAMLAAATLSPAARGANLQRQLQDLIDSANLGNTHVAFMVRDLASGETLATQDADQAMIPASNSKLITTAAALDVLGPQFVYHTRLNQLPPAEGQPLPRLVVIGDGDPAFGDPILLKKFGYTVDNLLDQWVNAVVKTHITHFGTLVIDDRVFDRQFIYPDWPRHQLIRDYCAQVAGIDFYRNCLDVTPIPAPHDGQPATIKIFPAAPFLNITNNTVTKRHGYFAMDRKLGTNHLIFTGSVSQQPSEPYQITVNDPPMTFGKIFANALKNKGISVDHIRRPAPDAQLPQGKPLAVATTALPLVLARTAQDSQNMFAESLFKRIGRKVTGQPGSWKNGAAAVRIFLQKRIGPASAVVHIVDGSGMSRNNRVTVHALVSLLAAMHAQPKRGEIYMHCLAHAGVNGTLDDRMKHLHNAEVYAKTGYLDGVSALSGYLLLEGKAKLAGKPHIIVFSFLFNGFKPPIHNFNLKKLQDRMVRVIIGDFQPAAVPASQ